MIPSFFILDSIQTFYEFRVVGLAYRNDAKKEEVKRCRFGTGLEPPPLPPAKKGHILLSNWTLLWHWRTDATECRMQSVVLVHHTGLIAKGTNTAMKKKSVPCSFFFANTGAQSFYRVPVLKTGTIAISDLKIECIFRRDS